MPYKNIEDRRAHDKERHRKEQAAWRVRQGDDYKSRYRRYLMKHKYGITWGDFEQMLEGQRSLCAACAVPMTSIGVTRVCVDHDHMTGKVRGLLCCSCNRTIGHAAESVARLQACATYLTK